MSDEKSKQLPCKPIKNVCLEVSDDVYRNINKSVRNEIDHQVCTEGAENEPTIIENNTSINGTLTEKIPTKVSNFEKVTKNPKGHFKADQNKCSTSNETLYLNPERISSQGESVITISNNLHSEKCYCKFTNGTVTKGICSPVSVDSDQENFCCGNLSDSCVVSAKFSMLISLVLLLISVQKFFKSSGEDETNTKMLLFTAGVYALCYLHCARKLICGIEKNVREKFIAWIGFSVLSVVLLFSGAIYVAIISWDELKEIHNEPIAGCQAIASILFLVLIGCILGLSFVALIILGSRLHQVDKEAGFLQVILNTWFRESVAPPPASAGQTRGSGATAGGQQRNKPMLTEQAQRTLLAFREDIRYFYRELDAARMTLILSIVFVGIFILSWWWMAFAIKQARSDGGVSLRTVLLLAVFAAVDVAASTGFILLRIIMYIRKDHLFPQEMRKPIPSLEYDQLAAYAALRLFTIQSSCGSIDILVIIVVGFLTGLRVYSVVCVFSYYKKAKNGSMDLFEHKNATGESDTSSRIERLKILDDYGAKTLVGKYSKRNGLASGLASLPRRGGDRSRLGSVTGSTYDEDPPELKIQAADMPLEMQRSAVFSATQAIKLYSTEKHIAESIKQDFDTMYHPTWHCIVGRNWGSCVTHSKQCYVRLAYKELTILLYRST